MPPALPFAVRLCCLFALAGLVIAGPARAQTETRLTPSSGALWARFGFAAAAEGNVALLGAPQDRSGPVESGTATVFRRTDGAWAQEARLTPPDAAFGDLFGSSVAVDGDLALVGAPGADGADGVDVGAAYVFRREGSAWVQEARLAAADGTFLDAFGSAVALDGEVALVGAPGDNGGGNGRASGSAYVFRRTNGVWVQEAKLFASDGAMDEKFGGAVALSGDVAVAGVLLSGTDDAGAAYVFRHGGASWSEEAKLTASDGGSGDMFGVSVAAYGDAVVVGSRLDDDHGENSGAAYVFRYASGTWAEEAKLAAADASADAFFGGAVAVDGDAVLVGASRDDVAGENSGSAYVFRRTGASWAQEAKLAPADGATRDGFGGAVALSGGDVALVGAAFDDVLGEDSGSAYAYDIAAGAVSLAGAVNQTSFPASGGTLTYTFTATNGTGSPQPLQLRAVASRGGSEVLSRSFGSATLPAGASATRSVALPVPASAPEGTYEVTYRLLGAGGAVWASQSFTITKSAAADIGRGGAPSAAGPVTAFSASAGGALEVGVHPNPAVGVARVTFGLSVPQVVRVEVLDALGRRVAVLHDGAAEVGQHALAFDGSSLPAGVYVVRVAGETFAAARRLTLVR